MRVLTATLAGLVAIWAIGAVRPTIALAAACVDSPSPTTTVYLPNVTKTLGGRAGWVTPFVVQNTGSSPTDIEVSFYRFDDGALVTCRRVAGLAPATSYADVPNDDPDLPDDTQFAVLVRSYGAPVAAVVNEQRGVGDATQASSYVGVSAGSTTAYLPNVTRRFYGYGVPFIVQNVGAGTASVAARFTSFDRTQGLTVPLSILPGRAKAIDPDFTAGLVDGTQYSVVVSSDQPVAVVANAHNEQGAPVAYAYNALTSGSRLLWAPFASGEQSGFAGSSPVVVQNLGPNDSQPTVTFFRRDGPCCAYVGAAQWFGPVLKAGESWVADPRFAPEAQGSTGSGPLAPGEYGLQVASLPPGHPLPGDPTAGNIAAIVLPTSETTAMAYAAVPDTSLARASYLPNVTRQLGGPAGWTTLIALQGAYAFSGAATPADGAILSFFRVADGQLVTRYQVAFGGGATALVDPRSVPDLPDGGYAVVVSGLHGSLVAVVFELATGGDSAMAYEGFPFEGPPQ